MLHSASGGIRLRLSAIAITDFSFAKPKLKEAAQSGGLKSGEEHPWGGAFGPRRWALLHRQLVCQSSQGSRQTNRQEFDPVFLSGYRGAWELLGRARGVNGVGNYLRRGGDYARSAI
jgi:hypothetical protein